MKILTIGKKQSKNEYSISLSLVSFENIVVGLVVKYPKKTNKNTEKTKLIIRQSDNHPISTLFSIKHSVKITKVVTLVENIFL